MLQGNFNIPKLLKRKDGQSKIQCVTRGELHKALTSIFMLPLHEKPVSLQETNSVLG